jgi:hypothetical protein
VRSREIQKGLGELELDAQRKAETNCLPQTASERQCEGDVAHLHSKYEPSDISISSITALRLAAVLWNVTRLV